MKTTTQHQQDATDDKPSADTSASTQHTPDTETSPSQLDRARHVAGHATIALAAGIDVELLTTGFENPVSVDRDGARFIDEGTLLHFPHLWPANPFERTRLAECLVGIALAGRCAELVHRQELCSIAKMREDEIDWQLAWKTASKCYEDEDLRRKYLEREVQRNATFLQHNQYLAAVDNISAALLEHGTLRGTQVMEIFERATVIPDAPARRPRRRPDYLSMPDSPGLPDCVVF